MPNYRRSFVPGGTYFFTLVTYQRQRILCDDIVRLALHEAIVTTRRKHPFKSDAWVLLHDHLHCILTLPDGDDDYSKRWSMIKRLVTQQVGGAHGAPYGDQTVGCASRTNPISASRKKRREGNIWQRRFWEHQVRDEQDLNRCRDYLHWNPVKHGLVSQVNDWPYSTFHRFVNDGIYERHWGGSGIKDDSGFGE